MTKTADPELIVTAFDAVRAQLGRQKWAVDTRNVAALPDIYGTNCELVVNTGGREGTTEISRVRGRDQIISFITVPRGPSRAANARRVTWVHWMACASST